jgi:GNAT superfamily N-acetyltransferase
MDVVVPSSVVLADGTVLACRMLGPADAPVLQAFHRKLSSQTQTLRFFGPHPDLLDDEALDLCTTDVRTRCALVALDHAGAIIGVGRATCAFDEPEVAEVAFVTLDAWQGRGVAGALLRALIAVARQVGIARFTADTVASNAPMIAVFEHSGLVDDVQVIAGLEHVEMDLRR